MGSRQQFLFIALLLHIPLFAYPILRLCQWLALSPWQTTLIFLPLFSSQIVARLYLRHANSGPLFWLRRGADLWLGVSPLLLISLLVTELPVAAGWIAPTPAALGLLGLTGLLTLYSIINAWSPSVVTVSLESAKLRDTLRFAQITDVHIGSRSGDFLQRVMDKVNTLDIDFLCITGDFIDMPGIDEPKLAALTSSPVPIYFCTGNHERYEDLDQIISRLQNLGVRCLRSQSALQGEVQIIGIDDSEWPGQVRKELACIDIMEKRFVLLLYHRPWGLSAAAEAGVDLMISGHTHNGQIVPFNLVVKRVFKRSIGLFQQGAAHLYVSPGTGTWGPIMRLGSRGEITLYDIRPVAEHTSATIEQRP